MLSEDDVPFEPAQLRGLWNFGDLPATDARFAALGATLDPASVRVAELATQRARICGLSGDFVEGHRLLDELTRPGHPVVRARIALERGRLLNSSGDPQASIPVFREAIDLARGAERDDLVADALHMLAIVDAEREADWYAQGVTLTGASTESEVRRWLGAFHNNHGWALHDAGCYGEALDAFCLARDTYGETGSVEAIRAANWAVARCLRSLGRRNEALAIQQRLKADGPPSPYVDEELAILESGE